MNEKGFRWPSFLFQVLISFLASYQTAKVAGATGENLWIAACLPALIAAKAFLSQPNDAGSAEVVTTAGDRATVERAHPDEGEPPDLAGPDSTDDVTPSPIRPEQGVFFDRQTGMLTVPTNGPATLAPATKGTL